jgi:hypothetical protein
LPQLLRTRRIDMRIIPGLGRARPTFTADLSGDVVATIDGHATFTHAAGRPGHDPRFDLGLGLLSVQGAVLFTLSNGRRPSPGSHRVTGRSDGRDRIRARVVLGPLERPLADLRARSGRLTIVSATQARIEGRFVLSAIGRERDREPLRVVIRGSFVARAA